MNNLETASSIIRLKIDACQRKKTRKLLMFIVCMFGISFIVVPRLKGTGIYELISLIVSLYSLKSGAEEQKCFL